MASPDSAIRHMIRTNVASFEELNIQTFTKWINSKLGGKEPVVKDLIKDLQDGHILLSLLEVLLNVKLRGEKGKLRFHKINNVNKALKTLEGTGLKLHGISPEAIVDGNKRSILGLIWIIILHFQVQGIVFEEEDEKKSDDQAPRKKSVASQAEVERLLIKWVQDVLKGLNKSVPTTSFVDEINAEKKCKELYTELVSAYSTREKAVTKCVTEVSSTIQKLQQKREVDADNPDILRQLRNEQTKLRLMRSELNVEEVVQQRSLKVFNEKCWKVFKPPSR